MARARPPTEDPTWVKALVIGVVMVFLALVLILLLEFGRRLIIDLLI